MYISLIITFILLLGIIITGAQNSMPLELKFITWNIQMSNTVLVFYSAAAGAAIIAVLVFPKLVVKYLKVRSLHKEISGLKREIAELRNQSVEKSKEKLPDA